MSRPRFQFRIGDFAVNGLNPAGLLVMMGLANIITEIVYHLSIPIKPKRVLAVVAITQRWPPSLTYATGDDKIILQKRLP